MHIKILILKLLEKMACLIFCVSTGVFWTLSFSVIIVVIITVIIYILTILLHHAML